MIRKFIEKYHILYLGGAIIAISAFARSYEHSGVYIPYQEQTELRKSIARGEEVYTDFCMQCHMVDGTGSGKVFPPLKGSDWLTSKRQETIYSVKYGLSGKITVNGISYNGVMTPQGLGDDEVADVLNYIMNSWGNTQEKIVTEKEVAGIQK